MPNVTGKGSEAFRDVRGFPQETEQLNEKMKILVCFLFVCRAASYWLESYLYMTNECIRYTFLQSFESRIFQKSYLCIY